MTPTAADKTAARTGRRALFEFVDEHGEQFTGGKVNEISGPQGECWTNAWEAAKSTPGRFYAEGYCLHRGRPIAHAFTVDAAGTVYEHTAGFERAGAYVGLRFDTSPGSEARKVSAQVFSGLPRCSLLEMTLGAGVAPLLALRNFGAKP